MLKTNSLHGPDASVSPSLQGNGKTANSFLLFGVTGDLAQRMLLPSLWALHDDELLPPHLEIVGSALEDLDDDGLRSLAETSLSRHLPNELRSHNSIADFLRRLH